MSDEKRRHLDALIDILQRHIELQRQALASFPDPEAVRRAFDRAAERESRPGSWRDRPPLL